ncbi:MAG: PhoH family protein [Spirochaetaceae bacterium]|nr:MAG: PhoH family protein [Spirochaetaceae bacterium]
MVQTAAVILDNPAFVSDVCGVNDGNLRVLEQLLDARIMSRGNELFIETEDAEKRSVLVTIVGELREHAALGRDLGPDLIRAVFEGVNTGGTDSTELLKRNAVSVNSSKVFPKSRTQALFIQSMTEHDLSFAVGPAGTGKTFLAVAHALAEVLSRRKRKLVLTRPVVEAGESLGFLPGDLSQKIQPYLKPLYDAMESLVPGETIQKLEDTRVIEVAPLAYMRGRSLRDCYVILDEAQNTTREQMKMFLTRIGENTRVVVTGDVTQIDLPRKKESGMLHAVGILHGIEDIGFTYFTSTDVVRNPLVKKIIQAYDANERS